MFHLVSGRPGGSFIFVDRGGGISSISAKGRGCSILERGEKESACLTHHSRTLRSSLSVTSENYLSLITVSMSFFLLKMCEQYLVKLNIYSS